MYCDILQLQMLYFRICVPWADAKHNYLHCIPQMWRNLDTLTNRRTHKQSLKMDELNLQTPLRLLQEMFTTIGIVILTSLVTIYLTGFMKDETSASTKVETLL